MSHPCPVEHCDRPAPGDATICGACTSELDRALDSVAWLAEELDVTLSRQTPRTGSGSSETETDRAALVLHPTAFPYSGKASDAIDELKTVLVGWARVLMEHDSSPAPADRLTSIATWLHERVGALVKHEAATEVHREILDAVRAAQRAVDRLAERTYAGPCPECGADVYARSGSPRGTCMACGHGVEVDEQQAMMRDRLDDHLAHAAEAGAALRALGIEVPDSTIRWFAQKGRILAHGHDRKRRPLYRIGDIVHTLSEGARTTRNDRAG